MVNKTDVQKSVVLTQKKKHRDPEMDLLQELKETSSLLMEVTKSMGENTDRCVSLSINNCNQLHRVLENLRKSMDELQLKIEPAIQLKSTLVANFDAASDILLVRT